MRRRRDTPCFIEILKGNLPAQLAQVGTSAELRARLPRLLQMVSGKIDRPRAGQVPLQDPVLTCYLSHGPLFEWAARADR